MPAMQCDDVIVFFTLLVVPDSQFIEIRSVIPDRAGARQIFCGTIDEAVAVVGQLNGAANLYVGACPRSRREGRRDAVPLVTAAWADLDFYRVDASDRERAEQIARERLDRFAHRPTILVHTGNGLQSWWQYDEPVPISNEWPAELFEAINRGLARALGGDAVHDLARVLRVPGTWNLPDAKKRARGCVPVMARLLHVDGPRYTPAEFRQLEAPDPGVQRRRQVEAMPIMRPTHPEAEIVEAFDKLLAQLGSGHPLVRTWRGDRFLKDASGSGFDMALAYHLVATHVRDQFIPAIVRAYRFGRGARATDAYIARTLAKAKAFWRDRHGAR